MHEQQWFYCIGVFFNFALGLKLAYKVFRLTDNLSTHLQAVDTNCADGADAATAVVEKLKELRSEPAFNTFHADVVADCSDLGKRVYLQN